jgi:hypothetical protein
VIAGAKRGSPGLSPVSVGIVRLLGGSSNSFNPLQPFSHFNVTPARSGQPTPSEHKEFLSMTTMTNKAGIKTLTLPATSHLKLRLAAAATATAIALLAIPHFGHAQGIIGGAEQGSREGGRAAGPVGAVVGGAVGAGVGGAVGAIDGVFGVPYRHRYHCRGYYNRYHHYRCY